MYILLGGLTDQYKKMYESSMDVVKKHLLFRPMTPTNEDILFSGNIHLDLDTGERVLDPQGQHLACFAGGMFALGSKVFEKPEDMAIARKLTEGCVWAYKALPTGIMPEFFSMTPCANATDCPWDPVVRPPFSHPFPYP
jgi:mannosyl-oligosaccharide alpha-1,2-mannosidase